MNVIKFVVDSDQLGLPGDTKKKSRFISLCFSCKTRAWTQSSVANSISRVVGELFIFITLRKGRTRADILSIGTDCVHFENYIFSLFILRKHCIITIYLLTPWCRVLLEKLTGLQLVKKFPAFYGTRRFITALTSVRHLSLSWANPIQSTYPYPTSWRSILI